MNWEAAGAVAELLGAIGVIASLGYLASQIRSKSCDEIRGLETQPLSASGALRHPAA